MNIKKVAKFALGAVAVSQVAGVVGVAARFAYVKQAVRTGKAMEWVKEVVGRDIPVEFDTNSPTPAYIKDDKSKIVFRLSDEDLFLLATQPASMKIAIQSIAAHEKGHAVDDKLEDLQKVIHHAAAKGDYERYARNVLLREERAWELGRQYAPNKAYFDTYNKGNLQAYQVKLESERHIIESRKMLHEIQRNMMSPFNQNN